MEKQLTVDVLVVGAGGAGMTAALTAADRGLDTLLIEKSEYFGGNTARSGGGVWVPGNYALKDAGVEDTPEAAKQYLDSIVGDEVPKVRRDTYIDRGPEMMDFVRDRTPVRFSWVPQYSDYHPEAPGGVPVGGASSRSRSTPGSPATRSNGCTRRTPRRRRTWSSPRPTSAGSASGPGPRAAR